MTDINSITLSGRLVKEPELKNIGERRLAKFTLAVGESYKKDNVWQAKVSFVDCVAWQFAADAIGKRAKGELVFIGGKVAQESWETQSGEHRSKIVVVVDRIVGQPIKKEVTPLGAYYGEALEKLGEQVPKGSVSDFNDADIPF